MKLGLIAMSGVRVQNPELTALGLTLPGFVERSKVIASLPSLALLTLAGLTPRHIDVRYLELPDLSESHELPDGFDAVAISSYTAQIKDAYRLADRYRMAGVRVILGGLHVTACPEEAAQHADAVVLGEAEGLWPQVVTDLERKQLKQVYDARGESFDLAAAPMPRFDLLDPARYNRLTVQTQRGCPFSCEFCAASIRLSPRFKVKPVEKVIAEIRRIKEIWPNPFIELADDNSFANRSHAKRLVRAIAQEGIRWFTETDISVADDLELLAMLRDSGCSQLLIGLEAPSRRGLDGLETKSNWKAGRVATNLAAIERIQRQGITVNGCFILGLDGQDESSFNDVITFVRESGLYEVQVTLQTPFPGTPLYARLRDAGRLLEEDAWEACTLFDVTFKPQTMSASDLESRFHALIATLYSDDFRRQRRGAFRRLQSHAPSNIS
ncbi:radical SAM protein [Pelagibius sp.]|uniref:B12-binding domain-containing radical SAM protein n=1 Tax=Pelagibius sp. TaxID=1931238 RepID=UPI00260A8B42|nr:radical SAM protein [Pelagibius sp.]